MWINYVREGSWRKWCRLAVRKRKKPSKKSWHGGWERQKPLIVSVQWRLYFDFPLIFLCFTGVLISAMLSPTLRDVISKITNSKKELGFCILRDPILVSRKKRGRVVPKKKFPRNRLYVALTTKLCERNNVTDDGIKIDIEVNSWGGRRMAWRRKDRKRERERERERGGNRE